MLHIKNATLQKIDEYMDNAFLKGQAIQSKYCNIIAMGKYIIRCSVGTLCGFVNLVIVKVGRKNTFHYSPTCIFAVSADLRLPSPRRGLGKSIEKLIKIRPLAIIEKSVLKKLNLFQFFDSDKNSQNDL